MLITPKTVMVHVTIPTTAKVFLLEDDENRIAWFQEKLPNIVVARTAPAAIMCLKEQVFDFVFLDHDLGMLDPAGYAGYVGTGYDVARFLSGSFVGKNVFIHSWNAVGAARMKDILEGAYAVPFGQFEILSR